MTTFDFFTKETSTSSFIQDVLSSVNYLVEIHEDPLEKIQGTLVIWDLDSFPGYNEQALSAIREGAPYPMILAYAQNPALYSNYSGKLFDVCLSTEEIRVHLMSRISKLKEIFQTRKIFRERMSHLVGNSNAMEKIRKTVEKAILHSGPVLIQGETGVGKDLIARAVACIYDKYVTVNCSAIPENLFESELFGHTRGAFTGAQNERIGLFEAADGGAIFLDEIGDMPLHTQAKLLRVIQNQEIRPIGANQTRHIKVRIIAATNHDLKKAVREKRFREDLFYRLNVIPIQVEPLRERKEDIVDLANYFIRQYSDKEDFYTLSPAAKDKLTSYNWPGNIRELENTIQRTLCFVNPGMIQAEDLQIDEEPVSTSSYREGAVDHREIETYDEFREQLLQEEREFLMAKIQEAGSVSKAAKKIGLVRTALYNRLSRLGVDFRNIK